MTTALLTDRGALYQGLPLRQPSDLPPGLVPPRYATARDWHYATYGGHAAAVAAAMGTPFMPWQRYVADVALEVDAFGIFRYSLVVVTIQRQAGKTALDLSCGLQNALMGPGRRVWYTAQDGQNASGKWREMAETFDGSKLLRPMARPGSKGIRLSNGSEAITMVNGSTIRPHPPTRDALHGKQSDRNTADEAWAHTYVQGSDLRQAIGPTTTTRRMKTGQRPQLWILSTEGTVESTFLNPLLDGLRAEEDPSVAFFDWGLRDGDDPQDLEVVAARHPGFGYTLDRDTLADQWKLFQDAPGEFARAFGNVRTGATERLIPAGPWTDAAWNDPFPDGRVALAAAVGIDGMDTSIAVGTRRDPGTVVTALVKDGHQAGTAWAIGRLRDLQARHGAPVVIDNRGPSAGLYDAAVRAGLDVLGHNAKPGEPRYDAAAATAAASTMLEGITTGAFRYRPHEALDAAAELATRRYIGDGAWMLGRRASVGSISALEAITLAGWGADHLPVQVGFQLFVA